MTNIAYVGTLIALLDIDADVVHGLIDETFARKPKLLDSNKVAIRLGYEYAKEHFECPLPVRLETMDSTSDCVLMTGNAAAALGCVYAGATVGAWYPITPATSVRNTSRSACSSRASSPATVSPLMFSGLPAFSEPSNWCTPKGAIIGM